MGGIAYRENNGRTEPLRKNDTQVTDSRDIKRNGIKPPENYYK